jgi:hypothetical protein
MSGFKEPGFADRQKAAQQAKKDLLNKFRAQPGPDDPEVAKRRAEREEAAAAEAARIAREKEEEEARLAAQELEQKAKRDARYAARKNRGKKK